METKKINIKKIRLYIIALLSLVALSLSSLMFVPNKFIARADNIVKVVESDYFSISVGEYDELYFSATRHWLLDYDYSKSKKANKATKLIEKVYLTCNLPKNYNTDSYDFINYVVYDYSYPYTIYYNSALGNYENGTYNFNLFIKTKYATYKDINTITATVSDMRVVLVLNASSSEKPAPDYPSGQPQINLSLDYNTNVLTLTMPEKWTSKGEEYYLNGADLYMYDQSQWDYDTDYYKKYAITDLSGWLDMGVYIINSNTFTFKNGRTYEFFFYVTYSSFYYDVEFESESISIDGGQVEDINSPPPIHFDYNKYVIEVIALDEWTIENKDCVLTDVDLLMIDSFDVTQIHKVADKTALTFKNDVYSYDLRDFEYDFYFDGEYTFFFKLTYSNASNTFNKTYTTDYETIRGSQFSKGSDDTANENRPFGMDFSYTDTTIQIDLPQFYVFDGKSYDLVKLDVYVVDSLGTENERSLIADMSKLSKSSAVYIDNDVYSYDVTSASYEYYLNGEYVFYYLATYKNSSNDVKTFESECASYSGFALGATENKTLTTSTDTDNKNTDNSYNFFQSVADFAGVEIDVIYVVIGLVCIGLLAVVLIRILKG